MAAFTNTIRDFHDETRSMRKKCKEAEAVVDESKKVATQAKLIVEEAEVQHLMLSQVVDELASKKKKVAKAKEKEVESKKKMERKVVEVGHLAIEAFRGLKELNDEKIGFSLEAFAVGQEECRQKIFAHFSNLDFFFLKEGTFSKDDQQASSSVGADDLHAEALTLVASPGAEGSTPHVDVAPNSSIGP